MNNEEEVINQCEGETRRKKELRILKQSTSNYANIAIIKLVIYSLVIIIIAVADYVGIYGFVNKTEISLDIFYTLN